MSDEVEILYHEELRKLNMSLVNLLMDSQEAHIASKCPKNNGQAKSGCPKCKSKKHDATRAGSISHYDLKSSTDRCEFARDNRTRLEYQNIGYNPVSLLEVPLGESMSDPHQSYGEDISHLSLNLALLSWEKLAEKVVGRSAKVLFAVLCDCTQLNERTDYVSFSALSRDSKSIKSHAFSLQQSVPLLVKYFAFC